MEIRYEPALRDYIKAHRQTCLVVEMVEINNSDLEVTELHVYFANPRLREQFIKKRRYRVVPTELGEILLPPFPLKLDEVITFGLKRFLFFTHVTYKGIKI